MNRWRRILFASPWRLWPIIVVLAGLDATGLYLIAQPVPQAARAAQPVAAPLPLIPAEPPPPPMIHPPTVADMLQSGTLIVISKASQRMFVFSDGRLWASTPVSTGKARHATPSGLFPVLQKRKYHRSNIYSGAPMPWMQRLTWEGIALHAGWVPGYPASHGCVRVPPEFAQSLFRLTDASATTVVIGDDPLETDAHAQQFALTARLPEHAALAPPDDPRLIQPAIELADSAVARVNAVFLGPPLPEASAPQRLAKAASPSLPVRAPAAPAAPASAPRALHGEIIQLAAAASQADAEAHWARMLATHPELGRFEKAVEPATVNAHPVYRLRLSGTDAHGLCAKLQREGIGCFNVS